METHLIELIESIERLEKAASFKPWDAERAKYVLSAVADAAGTTTTICTFQDAELIVALRNAATSLFQSLRSLMAENEALKKERDEWKWEYENVCKFTTEFEQGRDSLQAQLKVTVDALEKLSKAARNLLNQELNGVDCDAIDRVFQALPPRSPEAKLGAAQKGGGK